MNFRILIVDEDPAVYEDFVKILNPASGLSTLEEKPVSHRSTLPEYHIEYGFQGAKAIEMVKKSVVENTPYTLAFIDIKGALAVDGIEMIKILCKLDTNMEIVICTPYPEYLLDELVLTAPKPDKLLFFKKPMTPSEIKRLAHCLCIKWSSQKKDTRYIENLEILAHSKSQSFKILIECAITISQTFENKDAFHSVLETICRHTSFYGGHVFLVNEKGHLYSSDIWHFQDSQKTVDLVSSTEKIKKVSPGVDLPGHILVLKEAIIIDNLEKNSFFIRNKQAIKADIKAVVGIPILLGKRVMGVVELYSQKDNPIDKNLLEVLSETANLLSLSIERSLTEEELKNSRESALIAAKAKTEFLANMSHEIRTPLNAILGYTQILLKGQSITDITKENYLNIIEKSGNHLLGIINTILDLSKIESGTFAFKIKPLSLKALLNEIKSMFYVKCEQKNIAMHLDISDTTPPFVNGDISKLRHILINLISNSVKNTTTGSVLVTCMWTKGTIFFEVTDTGCGIAKEHLVEIFTPFFQVEQLEEREGTGLGLAIVKKEIELMKGCIAVDSTIGKGTTFKFQIPMAKAKEAKDDSGNIPIISELEEGQDWRILLIDNEKINKELLFDLFTCHHFKVFKSNYDLEAVQIAKEKKPHALYFNLNYPIFGNANILLKIKEACPNIIMIGITSETHEKISQTAHKLGCQEVIHKPFNINNVLYQLSKHLPIKYKFHKASTVDDELEKNVVLDWEEMGRMMDLEDLNILWEEFLNGDLTAIELTAQSIKAKNPKLRKFCDQLIFWTKEFNDSEIGLCLEKIESIKEINSG